MFFFLYFFCFLSVIPWFFVQKQTNKDYIWLEQKIKKKTLSFKTDALMTTMRRFIFTATVNLAVKIKLAEILKKNKNIKMQQKEK